MRQGRSHAPKLPSALLGAPPPPPPSPHRQLACTDGLACTAADGMSECHADHRTNAGGGPRCVGEEGVGDKGTHAATQLTNEGMAGCANGAKGANGKDY